MQVYWLWMFLILDQTIARRLLRNILDYEDTLGRKWPLKDTGDIKLLAETP